MDSLDRTQNTMQAGEASHGPKITRWESVESERKRCFRRPARRNVELLAGASQFLNGIDSIVEIDSVPLTSALSGSLPIAVAPSSFYDTTANHMRRADPKKDEESIQEDIRLVFWKMMKRIAIKINAANQFGG